MLTTLRVKNLALVENIRMDFQPGLNVITGETGAGKSILIGALNLLLGERADRTLIRAGEDACVAEACFVLRDPSDVDAILEEFGLPTCEDGQLIVRRIVRASGSTQSLINDSQVTLQVLERIGKLLVDMHGPHDHQSLLSQEFQLDLLDAFGHLWDERGAYEEVYQQTRALEDRRTQLTGVQNVPEQIDLLSYRAKELEEAAPVEGEEEKILQEHTLVGNAQRVLELSSAVLNSLVEGETSVFDALAGAQKALEELARLVPEAGTWRDEAREIAARIQDLTKIIHSVIDRVEADPSRLGWLDQRLATYQKLKKKYAPTVPGMLEILGQSKERLRELQNLGEELKKIDADLAKLREVLTSRGATLRKKRKAAAAKLADAVTQELRALGFAHGSFSVELRDGENLVRGVVEKVVRGNNPLVGVNGSIYDFSQIESVVQ